MDSDRSSDHEIANPAADVEDKFATTRESAKTGAPMALLLKSAGSQTIPFGRYEILRVLGEGAMGSVYLARDTQLQREVAIKVPKLDEGDRADLHRFYREARTMATLRHPHLCPVFDVGEIGGVHFFTMAYIEGGTLVNYLTEGEGLPDRQVARLIAKTASALDAAHQAGIVHRDLKPANIMIDRNKEPVVMDFGLAGVADANASLTQWGEMLGTPAYMAPEQIRGDLDLVGPACDVYSLGAIMYQMLTGHIPFDGSVATVVRKALDSEPAELASLTNHVDAELSAICRKAMSKDPRERFGSASEMANALRDFLLGKHRPEKTQPAAASPAAAGSAAAGSAAAGPAAAGSAAASSAAASSAAATITAQLDQQAARVRELWGDARYTDALPILESLARQTDAPAAHHAAWAREEIPKVRAKIKQAESAGDWLSAANVAAPTHLGPPVRYLRSDTSDSLPPWLMWAMAAPAAVVVLLIVLVVAGRWNGAQPARATNTNKPADIEPTGRVNPVSNEPGKQAVATDSKVAPTRGEPEQLPGDEPQTILPPAVVPVGQPSPDRPSPNQPPAGNDPSNPSPPNPDSAPQFPKRGGPPPRRPPPPRDAAGILRDLDSNKDGQLTANEIPPNHRPHLMRADTDGDTILTRAELEAFHQRPGRPPNPR